MRAKKEEEKRKESQLTYQKYQGLLAQDRYQNLMPAIEWGALIIHKN